MSRPLSPLAVAAFAMTMAVAACGEGGPTGPGGGGGLPVGRPVLDPAYRPSGLGTSGAAFVHLFEWPWQDLATECENVLGPAGWEAVQVSPPQEHAVVTGYPWWQRYQPVSYALESRSGTAVEFADMVARCGAAGVDVYVDAVLNHMTAGSGTGSGGTVYTKYAYPGLWTAADFHPACGVSDYQNAANVQDCELLGLADLRTGRASVRARLTEYLLSLVRLGVDGFRLDAAKHIQPVELDSILGAVNTLADAEGLPLPYFFAEVIDYGGEAVGARDYFGLGYATGGSADITEFRYRAVGEKFALAGGQTPSQLSGLSSQGWGLIPSDKSVVFIQNHDTQRDAGSPAVRYGDGDAYRLANVFMLAHPYGYPKVMSGYAFVTSSGGGRDVGPPSGAGGETLPVSCAPSLEDADPGDWVCEHRDPAISAMVTFRRAVAGAPLTGWWDNGAGAVAFSRGDRGFVALNRETASVTLDVATPMTPGTYCDLLTGGLVQGVCAGRRIEVASDGRVRFDLEAGRAVAIHDGTLEP